MQTRQPHPLRPLVAHLRTALVGLACTAALPHAPAIAAEPAAAAIAKTYALPAGQLSRTLYAFAAQAGITLTFDPALTEGLNAPSLSGSYSPQAGLDRLLAGSGLEAVRGANGEYRLRRLPAANRGEAALAPVTVTAAAERSGVTEGTGSYTARSSTAATRLPMSLRETPQSISVITRQRIEDENLNSVESMLDRTPGISVQNIGTSRYSILSRGYGINRYQIDGILTSSDSGTQNEPPLQADLVIYDRVEVLRGAAGLLNGTGDPSGTISLIRKKPTREFQGYVGAGIGNWQRYRSELDVAGPLNGAGSLRGRFVGAHEQGATHIDRYEQQKSVLYGVLEADLTDRTLLTLGLDYQKTDPRGTGGNGLPLFYDTGEQTRFSPSANAAARWSKDEIEAYNAFLNLEHRLANDWSLKFSANHLYGTRNFSGASASWGFPDRNTGDGVMLYGGVGSARQQQSGFDVQIQGPFEWWGRRHEFVLGFNWSEYKNFHEPLQEYGGLEGRGVNLYRWGNETAGPVTTGEKLFDYDLWQKQHGTYAALRLKPRDDLTLIAGARISNYRYRQSLTFTDPALSPYDSVTTMRESGVVTPYAGVVHDLDDTHSVYASYTSIFQPQSSRDRNGAVLEPRTGDNYEIGLKSEFFDGRLNSAIALYRIRQDNLAEADPGQTVPGTSPAQAAYRAVSGARTQGIDIEITGQLRPDWQIGASYNYSTTEDAGGQRIRTVFPRQMAKLWTSYRLPGEWNRLTLGGGMNWQSRIHYSATDWQLPGIVLSGEQKSYAVVNLMARYVFTRQLSATLNLNNVFDKGYLQGLDTTFHTGIYAPTRNAWLNLRYNF